MFCQVSRYFCRMDFDEESTIIWHSVFGQPMLVSKDLAERLVEFRGYKQFVAEAFLGAAKEEDPDGWAVVQELMAAHILTTPAAERVDIIDLHNKHNPAGTNKVRSLSLIMSNTCPFRCRYCIHFANASSHFTDESMMSEAVAKRSIDEYFFIVAKYQLGEAYVNFGGGEPLTNWRILRELLPYVDSYRHRMDISIRMGINTNLALLTEEIAKDLIRYGVEVAASLDGLPAGNNAVRLTKNLEGTYDLIMRGFKIMEDLGRPLDGFAMTVTEDNFADVDTPLIDWAAKRGMHEVRIDVDVVGIVNVPVSEVARALIKVRQYGKTRGINVIGFWSRAAENLGLDPTKEDIGFCGGERGNSLCVAPSGDVFPCGYSNYRLGSYREISRIEENEAYQKLLWQRDLSMDAWRHQGCRQCPIFGFCRGGCMITHEANSHDPAKQLYMCELYREMTYEILRESVAEMVAESNAGDALAAEFLT